MNTALPQKGHPRGLICIVFYRDVGKIWLLFDGWYSLSFSPRHRSQWRTWDGRKSGC